MPPIAATSRIILSVSVRGSAAAIASAPGIHDVQQTDVTTLWDFNVASSDASTLRRSGRNEFLFAPVGTEANGMTLSVVSLLARLGSDPWLEAGRLAALPQSEATESLAHSIVSMPTSRWSLQSATVIAAGSIRLLPTQVPGADVRSLTPEYDTKLRRSFAVVIALVCIVCVVALEAGVIPRLDVSRIDDSGVVSPVSHQGPLPIVGIRGSPISEIRASVVQCSQACHPAGTAVASSSPAYATQ
jgi:hypothetical protein